MLKLLQRIFTSKVVKVIVRIIASFASAIVVVSGYLFIVNMNERDREEIGSNENEEESEDKDSSEEWHN